MIDHVICSHYSNDNPYIRTHIKAEKDWGITRWAFVFHVSQAKRNILWFACCGWTRRVQVNHRKNKDRTAELALVDVSFDSVCILTSFSAMSMLVSPWSSRMSCISLSHTFQLEFTPAFSWRSIVIILGFHLIFVVLSQICENVVDFSGLLSSVLYQLLIFFFSYDRGKV